MSPFTPSNAVSSTCVCVSMSRQSCCLSDRRWQPVSPAWGLFLQGHLPRAVPAWPWVPHAVLWAGGAVGLAAPQAAQSHGGRWTWPAGPFTSAGAAVKSGLVTCNNFSFTLDCSKVLLSKMMSCSLRGSWTRLTTKLHYAQTLCAVWCSWNHTSPSPRRLGSLSCSSCVKWESC